MRGQRGQEIQRISRRFDLWIELDFDNNNNRVNFYQFKHYQMTTRKSQWKKVASKSQ